MDIGVPAFRRVRSTSVELICSDIDRGIDDPGAELGHMIGSPFGQQEERLENETCCSNAQCIIQTAHRSLHGSAKEMSIVGNAGDD